MPASPCNRCAAPVGPTSPCRTCAEPMPRAPRPHRGLDSAARLALILLVVALLFAAAAELLH